MGLTFYPIEDSVVLQAFRQQLCPFMNAVQKTTKREYFDETELESICDEIIGTAWSNQINNHLSCEWYHYIQSPMNRTLLCEHDSLIATNLE